MANLGKIAKYTLSSNVNITGSFSAPEIVIFDELVTGTLEGYDTETGLFTVPYTGIFSITVMMTWGTIGVLESPLVNAQIVNVGDATSSWGATNSFSTDSYSTISVTTVLNENDQIQIQVGSPLPRTLFSTSPIDGMTRTTLQFIYLGKG